ncbi:hypothetical protein, partial [Mesorhizobium sp. M0488]|uniref:hypothetical protein n=1 Tax=Mesorhizobium sp. M0488 TaxID=2956949 RepID=UPI0033357C6F
MIEEHRSNMVSEVREASRDSHPAVHLHCGIGQHGTYGAADGATDVCSQSAPGLPAAAVRIMQLLK